MLKRKFLRNDLNKILAYPRLKYGVKVYVELQRLYSISSDLTQDILFREVFDSFYGLTSERKIFYDMKNRNGYFKVFKDLRLKRLGGVTVTFNDCFKGIRESTQTDEVVFASKMLHTIDNSMPIMDSILIRAFKPKGKTYSEKYNDFCNEFKKFLATQEAKNIVNEFKKSFPGVNISEAKIIDFVIWADGKLK